MTVGITAALAVAVVVGCIVTVLGFLDGRSFPGELLAIFRVQILGAALVLALACAIAGRLPLAAVALMLVLVNALGLAPGLRASSRPDPEKPALRLLVANVWYTSDDYSSLLDLVERERPDVVGLTELSRDWADGVSKGLEGFPHRILQAQPGAYGIGLYSRLPLRDARIIYPAGRWPPVARATIGIGGRAIELFVIHAPAPIRRGAAARHREFMRSLGALARDAGETALVCGDFNASPWSGPYQDLRDRGGLARDDPWRPLEWSYPVWNRLLRVPIDQCLAGPRLAVTSRTGPKTGSDHLPLVVDVGF